MVDLQWAHTGVLQNLLDGRGVNRRRVGIGVEWLDHGSDAERGEVRDDERSGVLHAEQAGFDSDASLAQ